MVDTKITQLHKDLCIAVWSLVDRTLSSRNWLINLILCAAIIIVMYFLET